MKRGLAHNAAAPVLLFFIPMFLIPVFLIPVFLIPVFLIPVFLIPVFRIPVFRIPVFRIPVMYGPGRGERNWSDSDQLQWLSAIKIACGEGPKAFLAHLLYWPWPDSGVSGQGVTQCQSV